MKIRPLGPKLFLEDGRKDRRMIGGKDRRTEGKADGRTEGKADGRTDGGKDRRTDGRTGLDKMKLQVVFLKFAKAPYEST